VNNNTASPFWGVAVLFIIIAHFQAFGGIGAVYNVLCYEARTRGAVFLPDDKAF
jgi:hypothetical protein